MKLPRVPGYSQLSDRQWLQGRSLLPALRRHAVGLSGNILDVGCGRSPFRNLFPPTVRYIRVDRFPFDDDVILADASALPFDDESIQAVLLSQVIGDVPDLVALFRELFRVLKPGGKILVYETISYPQHDLPHDYWRVLPSGLKWVAERAQLTVSEIEYTGGYFTHWGVHWNSFLFGDDGPGWSIRSPARALMNVCCAALDRAVPRPSLATDYFACIEKNGAMRHSEP
jgi:SAM-dependent methyltransferase